MIILSTATITFAWKSLSSCWRLFWKSCFIYIFLQQWYHWVYLMFHLFFLAGYLSKWTLWSQPIRLTMYLVLLLLIQLPMEFVLFFVFSNVLECIFSGLSKEWWWLTKNLYNIRYNKSNFFLNGNNRTKFVIQIKIRGIFWVLQNKKEWYDINIERQNNVGTYYFIRIFFLLTAYIFIWNLFQLIFRKPKMIMNTKFHLASSN